MNQSNHHDGKTLFNVGIIWILIQNKINNNSITTNNKCL